MRAEDCFIDAIHMRLRRLTGRDVNKGILAIAVYAGMACAGALLLAICKNNNLI